MKKALQKKSSFRLIKQPYLVHEDDSLKEQIQRYMADPDRKISIDGRIYYRVLSCAAYSMKQQDFTTTVIIDRDIPAMVGRMMSDENNVSYCVKSIPFIRYSYEQYPDCLDIVTLLLDGVPEKMGDYLTVLQEDEQ